MYRLGLDPIAEDQITAVPQEALRPLAELFTVLEKRHRGAENRSIPLIRAATC